MLQVIIGGLLAILGGMIGMWLEARNARRIRMDEIIAEKKVIANGEAYTRIETIASMLIQSSYEDVNEKFCEYEEWFFNTRLFLPGKFPDKWLSIRAGVSKAVRLQKQLPKRADEFARLEDYVNDLANEAMDEIYKEMKLSRIKIESPSQKTEKE